MEHFNREEWHLYKKGRYPAEKLEIMRDHLAQCDQCLDVFLSLIDADEISRAERSISPDFTQRLMDRVEKEGQPSLADKKQRFFYPGQNIFAYYAAAAVVTLIFMGSGVFHNLAQDMPQVAINTVSQERMQDRDVYQNWSDRIVERTAAWIENFEKQDKRGVVNE